MSTKVLVAEDDNDIAELIRLYLTNQGFTVSTYSDGISAFKGWQEEQPDLAVLDCMLPGMNGWELCERIRHHSNIPIILVTAKGSLTDKLHGFELGVDDYLVKPFDPLELVARIRAVLRRKDRSTSEQPQKIELPGLTIDLETYTVLIDGNPVELTRRETQVLYFLASHPGRVFTREYLLQEIWGFDYPGGTRTVDVHINRLRDKAERPDLPWHIRTVWGVGYKFEVKS